MLVRLVAVLGGSAAGNGLSEALPPIGEKLSCPAVRQGGGLAADRTKLACSRQSHFSECPAASRVAQIVLAGVKIPRNRHGNDFVIPLVPVQRYLVFEGCMKLRASAAETPACRRG